MSTIALCLRQERIAPRYDQPDNMLLVTLDDAGKETARRLVPVSGLSKEAICKFVLETGVNTVICGGILPDCRQALAKAKVDYIDNVIGSMDAVLEAFAKGGLASGVMLD